MPVVVGQRPLIIAVREGPQIGRRHVGVGEGNTLRCQRVHMRCLDLRVGIQETGPVVHIVDGDKQHIGAGFISRRRLRAGPRGNERNQAAQEYNNM